MYSLSASGYTAPLRTLGGAATGLNAPIGIALDLTNNELFVANESLAGPSVTVYSRTASGNSAPLRTITGAATGLSQPFGVAVTTTAAPPPPPPSAVIIPTLHDWALVGLSVLLFAVALIALRRRHR